jgi:hypothetical protein
LKKHAPLSLRHSTGESNAIVIHLQTKNEARTNREKKRRLLFLSKIESALFLPIVVLMPNENKMKGATGANSALALCWKISHVTRRWRSLGAAD